LGEAWASTGRFKAKLYEGFPELISPWHAFRDVRAQRRAVDWLLDQGLIDENAAEEFAADHPEPVCPDASTRDDRCLQRQERVTSPRLPHAEAPDCQ
jgi:hypothetical protein